MTLDEFREKCCRLCGTQRCTGDGEWLNGCPHYHREVLREADYEEPAMKAVREYLENRIAESPVNERKQPNCDNCIWHPSGIAEGISHERLREITDAERDGRLVVLHPAQKPSKDGKERPGCFYTDMPGREYCMAYCHSKWDDEPIDACKECWYCDGYDDFRAEAEAALRGAKHE